MPGHEGSELGKLRSLQDGSGADLCERLGSGFVDDACFYRGSRSSPLAWCACGAVPYAHGDDGTEQGARASSRGGVRRLFRD